MEIKDRKVYEPATLKVVEMKIQAILCMSGNTDDEIGEQTGEW